MNASHDAPISDQELEELRDALAKMTPGTLRADECGGDVWIESLDPVPVTHDELIGSLDNLRGFAALRNYGDRLVAEIDRQRRQPGVTTAGILADLKVIADAVTDAWYVVHQTARQAAPLDDRDRRTLMRVADKLEKAQDLLYGGAASHPPSPP